MVALLTLASIAHAVTTTVSVDPLTTALGFVHVQVERVVSPSVSIYAGPHLRLFDGLTTDGHEPFRGYGVEAGARWFPKKSAPQGWWFMARTVGASLRTNDGALTSFGGYSSGLVGWTWVLDERWVLAAGVGAQRLYYTVGAYGVSGVLPAAHTNFGVAF